MSDVDFNCDCEVVSEYATLAALRTRMMIRLGYAAQAANPPPGMASLLDEFLQSAQKVLYKKNPVLRTSRFYRWTMDPGVRYYGITDNDSQTDFTDILAACTKHPDEYQIEWVGFEDLNGAWFPLIKGIDPTLYTTANQMPGWPSHYDLRACFEIWPAPSEAYKLWVKANFRLDPFTADTDQTTIDDELVFLYALGRAKKHYRQPDADDVLQEAGAYLLDLKAGKHATARYVPGTPILVPLTPPRFLPLGP